MVGQRENETREEFIERQRSYGRLKKGKKHKLTIDRERMLEEFKDSVARRSRTLMTAQMVLATGSIQVFRIDTEILGEGKNKKVIRKRPVLVTSTEEIIDALDYEYANGESPNDDEVYYFVTTKDPDNGAVKDLLDRTFGKAKESMAVEHSGTVGLAELLGKSALDRKE